MSRLCGKDPLEILEKRLETASEFAVKNTVYLILKGARTVIAAPDGSVWFGIYYSGTLRFKDGAWESFTVEDGLISPNVTNVYVDSSGAVWFATSGGVTRYGP
jgi:streptogramin lyase